MKIFRMRRAWAIVATVAIAAGLTPILMAGTASAATTATVSTDDEFFNALIDTNIVQIDLANDIDLTQQGNCGYYPERNSSGGSLLIDGHGFTLTQTCDDNSVVYIDGTGEALTLQNITLTHQGAPTPSVFGNGVYNDGPVTVLSSTITGNWAPGGFCGESVGVACLNTTRGGGISSNSDVVVTNSTVSNNRAADTGGGIYSGGTVTVTNSTISDNQVDSSGAVGGGIWSDGLLTVTGSTVSGNHANGSNYAVGGGAYSLDGAVVDGSTVSDNHAFCPGECYPAGGGLASEGGDTTVTSSNFLGNSATCERYCDNIGGGILTGAGSLAIAGSLVTQNGVSCEDSCQADGAGIFADSGYFFDSVENARAASHDVQAAGRGYLATITDSTISNNLATTTDTPGGDCDCSGAGAAINGAESLTVTRSTFSNNTALWDGGAIDVWSELTQVRIENSTITENQSSYDGAIDAWHSPVTTVYSTIDGNILNDPPLQPLAAGSRYGTHGDVQAAVADRPANLSANSLTTFATVFADPVGGPNCVLTGSEPVANSEGYNFSDDSSCGLTNTVDGDRENAGSPMLNVLAENGGPTATMLPYTPKTNGVASPLIDAIPVAACQTGAANGVGIDQRGVTRPQLVGCDIGAVEVTGSEYQVEAAVVIQPKFTG